MRFGVGADGCVHLLQPLHHDTAICGFEHSVPPEDSTDLEGFVQFNTLCPGCRGVFDLVEFGEDEFWFHVSTAQDTAPP